MHNVNVTSVLSLLVLGSVILTIIYQLVSYLFNKDKLLIDYLYYLFFAGFFIVTESHLHYIWFNVDSEKIFFNYFNEPSQVLFLAFYINFVSKAIDIQKSKSKSIFYIFYFTVRILLAYSILFVVLKYLIDFKDFFIAFISIRIFIFLVGWLMIYMALQLRHLTFQLFILLGGLFYTFFGLISFISDIYRVNFLSLLPSEWLNIGTFVDIISFSTAMAYRFKKNAEQADQIKLKNANDIIAMQALVLEKQKNLETERDRISSDLHDDLGSGLTKITYLSQMALNDNATIGNLQKINTTSSELIENMSEIIWAMKQDNDSLPDLITYIKRYAFDYLESNNIIVKFNIKTQIETVLVKGNYRRSIFLSVKELLHNIVKHANAKNVFIEISATNVLLISIQDDGIGIKESIIKGNGINNIKKRMDDLEGTFEIKNTNGTLTNLSIPINKITV